MLSNEARKALVGWKSHGSKIIRESFKTKGGITLNVIQCYALISDTNVTSLDLHFVIIIRRLIVR